MFNVLLDGKLFLAPIGDNPQVVHPLTDQENRLKYICSNSDRSVESSGCRNGNGHLGHVSDYRKLKISN